MTEDDILFMELEAAVKKEFEDNLPGGWVLSHSKKHERTYYFNTVTGESRWMHPLIPDDGAQVREKQRWKSLEIVMTKFVNMYVKWQNYHS